MFFSLQNNCYLYNGMTENQENTLGKCLREILEKKIFQKGLF